MIRSLVLLGAALLIIGSPTVAHGSTCSELYLDGKRFDDRYAEPSHFTGEKSHRDCVTKEVRSRESWVDGALEGPYVQYGLDGKIEEKGSYHHGKQHGVQQRFEHGVLRVERAYWNGAQAGMVREYDRDGVLECAYAFDPVTEGRDSEIHFNKAGQVSSLECGKRGIGQPDAEWCGRSGKRGSVTLYTDDGKPKESRQYVNGKADGIWKTFSRRTGEVVDVETYVNGKSVAPTTAP